MRDCCILISETYILLVCCLSSSVNCNGDFKVCQDGLQHWDDDFVICAFHSNPLEQSGCTV